METPDSGTNREKEEQDGEMERRAEVQSRDAESGTNREKEERDGEVQSRHADPSGDRRDVETETADVTSEMVEKEEPGNLSSTEGDKVGEEKPMDTSVDIPVDGSVTTPMVEPTERTENYILYDEEDIIEEDQSYDQEYYGGSMDIDKLISESFDQSKEDEGEQVDLSTNDENRQVTTEFYKLCTDTERSLSLSSSVRNMYINNEKYQVWKDESEESMSGLSQPHMEVELINNPNYQVLHYIPKEPNSTISKIFADNHGPLLIPHDQNPNAQSTDPNQIAGTNADWYPGGRTIPNWQEQLLWVRDPFKKFPFNDETIKEYYTSGTLYPFKKRQSEMYQETDKCSLRGTDQLMETVPVATYIADLSEPYPTDATEREAEGSKDGQWSMSNRTPKDDVLISYQEIRKTQRATLSRPSAYDTQPMSMSEPKMKKQPSETHTIEYANVTRTFGGSGEGVEAETQSLQIPTIYVTDVDKQKTPSNNTTTTLGHFFEFLKNKICVCSCEPIVEEVEERKVEELIINRIKTETSRYCVSTDSVPIQRREEPIILHKSDPSNYENITMKERFTTSGDLVLYCDQKKELHKRSALNVMKIPGASTETSRMHSFVNPFLFPTSTNMDTVSTGQGNKTTENKTGTQKNARRKYSLLNPADLKRNYPCTNYYTKRQEWIGEGQTTNKGTEKLAKEDLYLDSISNNARHRSLRFYSNQTDGVTDGDRQKSMRMGNCPERVVHKAVPSVSNVGTSVDPTKMESNKTNETNGLRREGKIITPIPTSYVQPNGASANWRVVTHKTSDDQGTEGSEAPRVFDSRIKELVYFYENRNKQNRTRGSTTGIVRPTEKRNTGGDPLGVPGNGSDQLRQPTNSNPKTDSNYFYYSYSDINKISERKGGEEFKNVISINSETYKNENCVHLNVPHIPNEFNLNQFIQDKYIQDNIPDSVMDPIDKETGLKKKENPYCFHKHPFFGNCCYNESHTYRSIDSSQKSKESIRKLDKRTDQQETHYYVQNGNDIHRYVQDSNRFIL